MLTLFTVSDVSEQLQISIPTIYRWVHKKQIPYVKLGGRVLFNPEEIQKFVSLHSVSNS